MQETRLQMWLNFLITHSGCWRVALVSLVGLGFVWVFGFWGVLVLVFASRMRDVWVYTFIKSHC